MQLQYRSPVLDGKTVASSRPAFYGENSRCGLQFPANRFPLQVCPLVRPNGHKNPAEEDEGPD
jgi:hypothetical protein